MAFEGLGPGEREQLRDELDLTARNFTALIKNRRDCVQAFRCVCNYGEALSKGQVNLEAWVRFAEIAHLIPPRPDAGNEKEFTLHRESTTGLSDGATPDEADAMVEAFEVQRTRDAVDNAANVVPPWRDTAGATWGRFNRQLATVGSGIGHRTIQSTAALSNITAALAPLNTEEASARHIARNELERTPVVMDRQQIEMAFLFASRGDDLLDFDNFVVLLHAVAAARFSHNYRDSSVEAVRRLNSDYLRNCVKELCPETFEDIVKRGSITRFPGVPQVLHIFRKVLQNVVDVFAGSRGKAINVIDIISLCDSVGCFRAPHMSPSQVKHTICEALQCKLSAMPHEVSIREFVDILCFVGFYLYNFEPHKALIPTVAARVFEFLRSWGDWYSKTLGEPITDVMQPLPAGPPVVCGFSSSRVNARNSHVVDVFGRNFGNDGCFFRFGRLVTAAPRCSDTTARVHVPPVSANTINVRLRVDGDDFVAQLVYTTQVFVTASRDGHTFSDPSDVPFTFEDAYPEAPIAQFQPKLLRIYQNYCRQGAAKAALDTSAASIMRENQWKKVLGEFHLVRSASGETPLDPSPEELASEAYQSERAAMSEDERKQLDDERAIGKLFARYAVQTAGKVDPGASTSDDEGSGAEVTKLNTLSFDRFVRALVHATVIVRGYDIHVGLRAVLASDKWVGRELLDDIPAAHKGDLALRIRRAANSFQLMKVMDHMSHNNTPRDGVFSIPVLKREVSHLPGGRWENEHDHDSMTLHFLARQREIEDEALEEIKAAMVPLHLRDDDDPVTAMKKHRVQGPAVDPVRDPPAVRHQEMDVEEGTFIPGLRTVEPPVVQETLAASTPTPAKASPRTASSTPPPVLTSSPPAATPRDTPTPVADDSAAETPFAAPASLKPSRKASQGSPKGSKRRQSRAGGTVFGFQNKVVTAAEERAAAVRKEGQNLSLHAQRHRLVNTQIHADTRAQRHKREMQRMTEKLDEERQVREELERKLEAATRYQVPEDDLAFSSHPTVLRAEKNALQREFIRQVERKKNKLESEMAHVEIMRDLERDRVVTELKEKMQSADFMYKRLQETVRGQTESIKREAEMIALLKTRVNLLLEDSRFFRETHDSLLAAVDKGKNKDLLEQLESQKQEHEVVMIELTQQLVTEARAEGRRQLKSLKEGLPKRRANQPVPDDPEALLKEVAAQGNVFELPEGPTLVATFTEEEVDSEKAKAVEKAVGEYVTELTDLERKLSNANADFELKLREAAVEAMKQQRELEDQVSSLEGRELAQQEEAIEMAARLHQVTEELEKYKAQVSEFEATGNSRGTHSSRRRRRRGRETRLTGGAAADDEVSGQGSPGAASLASSTHGSRLDLDLDDQTPDTSAIDSSPPSSRVQVGGSRRSRRSESKSGHAASDAGSPLDRSTADAAQSVAEASVKVDDVPVDGISAVDGAPGEDASASPAAAAPDAASESTKVVGDGSMTTGDDGEPASLRSTLRESNRSGARRGSASSTLGGNDSEDGEAASPGSQRRSQRRSLVNVDDCETQTEATDDERFEDDEDVQWIQQFGKLRNTARVDHVKHELHEDDTIDGIAAAYDVSIQELLTANFIPVPEGLESLEDDDLWDTLEEINVSLRGIPSRTLTIPVPLGMAETIEELVAERHEQGKPMSLDRSGLGDEPADGAQDADGDSNGSADGADSDDENASPPPALADRRGTIIPSSIPPPATVRKTASEERAAAAAAAREAQLQTAAELGTVAQSLKAELAELRKVVTELPAATMGLLGGTESTQNDWTSQLQDLIMKLQPPPEKDDDAVELAKKRSSFITRRQSMKKKQPPQPSPKKSVALLSAIAEDAASEQPTADAAAAESSTPLQRHGSRRTPVDVADGDSVARRSSVPAAEDSASVFEQSMSALPARDSSVPTTSTAPLPASVTVESDLSTAERATGVATRVPSVASLLPVAVAKGTPQDMPSLDSGDVVASAPLDAVADVVSVASAVISQSDAPGDRSPLSDAIDGAADASRTPAAGPSPSFLLDEDRNAQTVGLFGSVRPQRKLKSVPVYHVSKADDEAEASKPVGPPVKQLHVWVAGDSPAPQDSSSAPGETSVRRGHTTLFLSGAAARQTDPRAPPKVRPRGQTLARAGLGGALLMAETHGRLALVLSAEATMKQLFQNFLHGIETLARGSVVAPSPSSSSPAGQKKKKKSSTQHPALQRSEAAELRRKDSEETYEVVQQRRSMRAEHAAVAKQARSETLEARATAAVRQKRMLNEVVRDKREADADVGRRRRMENEQALQAPPAKVPEATTPPSSPVRLPPIAATPPPRPTMVDTASGPNPPMRPRADALERALPPPSLTPEPKVSLPPAVKRQIAGVKAVDEKLRSRREAKARAERLHTLVNPHATAARRRDEQGAAAFRGGAPLHPDLEDALATVRPEFASRSAPVAGAWSKTAKSRPLRVPPLAQ